MEKNIAGKQVAPHAGAWIETLFFALIFAPPFVAPHAGAWIETLRRVSGQFNLLMSRPTRARGLKPF